MKLTTQEYFALVDGMELRALAPQKASQVEQAAEQLQSLRAEAAKMEARVKELRAEKIAAITELEAAKGAQKPAITLSAKPKAAKG